MAQTINRMMKKQSHKEREMKKFGNQIVNAVFAKANEKEFWYKKFMDYAASLKLWERLKICWKILRVKK